MLRLAATDHPAQEERPSTLNIQAKEMMMAIPGFTAEAALAPSRRVYRRRIPTGSLPVHVLQPQEIWGDCSDGSPALCYFCSDEGGCSCEWYYGSTYVVSSDCGSG